MCQVHGPKFRLTVIVINNPDEIVQPSTMVTSSHECHLFSQYWRNWDHQPQEFRYWAVSYHENHMNGLVASDEVAYVTYSLNTRWRNLLKNPFQVFKAVLQKTCVRDYETSSQFGIKESLLRWRFHCFLLDWSLGVPEFSSLGTLYIKAPS